MKAKIVRIGNSRGIRIPKALMQQCRFATTVELEVKEDHLIVRAEVRPRRGWSEAFRLMAEHCDDLLLDRDSLPQTQWDRTEWKWYGNGSIAV